MHSFTRVYLLLYGQRSEVVPSYTFGKFSDYIYKPSDACQGTLRRGVDPCGPITHYDVQCPMCVCDPWCLTFPLIITVLLGGHPRNPTNTSIPKSKFWYSMSYTRAANMSTTPDVWCAPFPLLLCGVHALCPYNTSITEYELSHTMPHA